jgi:hypothetical protein
MYFLMDLHYTFQFPYIFRMSVRLGKSTLEHVGHEKLMYSVRNHQSKLNFLLTYESNSVSQHYHFIILSINFFKILHKYKSSEM